MDFGLERTNWSAERTGSTQKRNIVRSKSQRRPIASVYVLENCYKRLPNPASSCAAADPSHAAYRLIDML